MPTRFGRYVCNVYLHETRYYAVLSRTRLLFDDGVHRSDGFITEDKR